MPIFHFDVRAGSELAEDEDGADFPDLAAAEEEARRDVLEIAKYRLLDGHDEISVQETTGSDAIQERCMIERGAFSNRLRRNADLRDRPYGAARSLQSLNIKSLLRRNPGYDVKRSVNAVRY